MKKIIFIFLILAGATQQAVGHLQAEQPRYYVILAAAAFASEPLLTISEKLDKFLPIVMQPTKPTSKVSYLIPLLVTTACVPAVAIAIPSLVDQPLNSKQKVKILTYSALLNICATFLTNWLVRKNDFEVSAALAILGFVSRFPAFYLVYSNKI